MLYQFILMVNLVITQKYFQRKVHIKYEDNCVTIINSYKKNKLILKYENMQRKRVKTPSKEKIMVYINLFIVICA